MPLPLPLSSRIQNVKYEIQIQIRNTDAKCEISSEYKTPNDIFPLEFKISNYRSDTSRWNAKETEKGEQTGSSQIDKH